jgi:hypothetical protein
MTTSRPPRRCWPILTSASPRSRASPRRVPGYALSRYPRRANRGYPRRLRGVVPKDRTPQDGSAKCR